MIAKPSKIKIAVIGCGVWGKNLVRNFYNLGSLSTFVEENSDTASFLENQYNIQQHDLSSVLQDPRINAVAVAVPSSYHFNIAKQALMAGKHLFIEKPVTLSLSNSAELIKLAEDRKLTFMTGHLPRYHPAFQKMKAMVDAGEIGKVGYVYSNRLNLGRIRTDENVLWDLAPHDLSMLLSIVGDHPVEVHTHGSHSIHNKVLDTAMVSLSFTNGVKGHIFNSWLHPFKEHRFVVVGDKGMLVFDDGNPWESKLVAYHHKIEQLDNFRFETLPKEAERVNVEPDEPLKIECEHFLHCVEKKLAPLTGPKEALRVMTVLDKIETSLLESAKVNPKIQSVVNE